MVMASLIEIVPTASVVGLDGVPDVAGLGVVATVARWMPQGSQWLAG
jgi:hypothetical protein